jgi:hypothetical protein
VAARLTENAALELIKDGERISLERLEAEPEPASLVELRRPAGRVGHGRAATPSPIP